MERAREQPFPYVPQPHRLVIAARSDEGALGVVGDAVHVALVAAVAGAERERLCGLALDARGGGVAQLQEVGLHVPDLDRRVAGRARNHPARRAGADVPDPSRVPLQEQKVGCRKPSLPHPDGLVARARDQILLVGAEERDALDVGGVSDVLVRQRVREHEALVVAQQRRDRRQHLGAVAAGVDLVGDGLLEELQHAPRRHLLGGGLGGCVGELRVGDERREHCSEARARRCDAVPVLVDVRDGLAR
mmetsp:Transcript_33412/g.78816  ORF Transcript_33412/g.78816 Transcript_33412/m.78816 type:complete len:247 (-) Transcript_33412:941-1681(-)